jgi:hypothetical protein
MVEIILLAGVPREQYSYLGRLEMTASAEPGEGRQRSERKKL